MLWRPGVPLSLAQLKEAVLRWRGGVRYGGAVVTVSGQVEPGDASAPRTAALLRVVGTQQRFRLSIGHGAANLPALGAGEVWRVTGRVIKSEEGKEDEIWLELEHAEPVSRQK